MSDKVKIKVSAASKREKTIDFQIVGMKSNKKKKKTVIINKRRDRKPKQKFKEKEDSKGGDMYEDHFSK